MELAAAGIRQPDLVEPFSHGGDATGAEDSLRASPPPTKSATAAAPRRPNPWLAAAPSRRCGSRSLGLELGGHGERRRMEVASRGWDAQRQRQQLADLLAA